MGLEWVQIARRLAADGSKIGILSSSGKGQALAKELDGIAVTGPNKAKIDLSPLDATPSGIGLEWDNASLE